MCCLNRPKPPVTSEVRNTTSPISPLVRIFTIKHSKKKSKTIKEKELNLQNQYNKAKQRFENDSNNTNSTLLWIAQKELETFYEKKVEGIIIRSRARWYEHGERSSKYFLNLEKRNHVKKHIRKLCINGLLTTDPLKILNEQKCFYQELYQSINRTSNNSEKISSFLDDLTIPKLSETDKNSCEGKISAGECYKLLESFQNNKTPGNDGIPIEFYKKFWSLISDPFIYSVNECFEKGEMSVSQKQAVITLIEKKGKDRSSLENWRPISLLNVDTKIMTKVLAARIKEVLPSIIHHNQTGYIKDRFIGETIRSIFDIMDFTLSENTSGLMIFIDFHKAFDSLEWGFLYKCLETFNFGEDFMRWVKTIYKNIESCTLNNGFFSEYFKLERGVRQGDPLSPYLFVLAIETLAIAIRQNSEIKGIVIGKEETKLLQYADDTTATLSDKNSATALFKLLGFFKSVSGLMINCTKTEGMWIGSTRHSKSKPFQIKWTDEPIKALGVYFTYDIKLLHEKNFLEKLDSIKKLINIWSSRGLSIYGKVTVVKSLLIPKFVYVSSLLPTPKELVKDLNRLLFKFLWKGTDKVTRVSTINDFEHGGLKMIDIDSMIVSLRLAWLKRIFSENGGTWKSYLCHLLKRFSGLLFITCNYDLKDYPKFSQFYHELLSWWTHFRNTFDSERNWCHIIWNNKEIRIENKPVYYKKYFESGIIFVKDLLFHLNIQESFNCVKRKLSCKTNLLLWAGLRHSIPINLKLDTSQNFLAPTPILKIKNNTFDVTEKKSRDYYILLISNKAQFPNATNNLRSEFHLSTDQLKQVFILPHIVAFEPYIKAFQYKILNSILFTNVKLHKIGFKESDLCSFCETAPETLHHLLFLCSYSRLFWSNFEGYWLSLTNERIQLSLQDVVVGIISSQNSSLVSLLNFFIIIGKLYLWDCRRDHMHPDLQRFKVRLKLKHEIEHFISLKNNNYNSFKKKWIFPSCLLFN